MLLAKRAIGINSVLSWLLVNSRAAGERGLARHDAVPVPFLPPRPLAEAKGIALTAHLVPVAVRGDALRLGQVIVGIAVSWHRPSNAARPTSETLFILFRIFRKKGV